MISNGDEQPHSGSRARNESFTVVEELRPGAIEAAKTEEEKINRSMGR